MSLTPINIFSNRLQELRSSAGADEAQRALLLRQALETLDLAADTSGRLLMLRHNLNQLTRVGEPTLWAGIAVRLGGRVAELLPKLGEAISMCGNQPGTYPGIPLAFAHWNAGSDPQVRVAALSWALKSSDGTLFDRALASGPLPQHPAWRNDLFCELNKAPDPALARVLARLDSAAAAEWATYLAHSGFGFPTRIGGGASLS